MNRLHEYQCVCVPNKKSCTCVCVPNKKSCTWATKRAVRAQQKELYVPNKKSCTCPTKRAVRAQQKELYVRVRAQQKELYVRVRAQRTHAPNAPGASLCTNLCCQRGSLLAVEFGLLSARRGEFCLGLGYPCADTCCEKDDIGRMNRLHEYQCVCVPNKKSCTCVYVPNKKSCTCVCVPNKK